jgi:hypothetical protein
MDKHRHTVAPPNDGRVCAAACKERVHNLKRRSAMLGREAREQASPPSSCRANVVNTCAEQVPRIGLWLLSEREHVHLVAACQALDQPEQAWDHAIHATPVHTPGYNQGDLHRRGVSLS